MGAGLARALGPHRAVLMKNRGISVAGTTLEETVLLSLMLERAARIQLLAEAAGAVGPDFPPDDVAELKRSALLPGQIAVNFAYLARQATGAPSPPHLRTLGQG
jgi:L-fuculose-phosphate aldolase